MNWFNDSGLAKASLFFISFPSIIFLTANSTILPLLVLGISFIWIIKLYASSSWDPGLASILIWFPPTFNGNWVLDPLKALCGLSKTCREPKVHPEKESLNVLSIVNNKGVNLFSIISRHKWTDCIRQS